MKRLQDKLTGRVLAQIMYIFSNTVRTVQQKIAIALAHLMAEDCQVGSCACSE